MAEEWNKYINLLVTNFIHLGTDPDKLVWTKNPKTGQYTTKLGYQVSIEDKTWEEKKWWWRKLWHTQSPIKTQITMWLALSNKLLTWEKLQKRGFEGPSICPLCRTNDETN